ncbi:MAG: hypothetical protein JXB60_00150 [Candidatus Cloacimonetes bacterium]|nr:hypothetical protein [Candidatus Cloacimonadota bacterium]
MRKIILFVSLLFIFITLGSEELFQARIYRQNSEPPELLFLHYNEHFSRADSTYLIHYYLLPDSTISVKDEVVLLNGEFYRARSHFYEVDEMGEVIRDQDKMLMRFNAGGNIRENHFDYQTSLLFGPLFNDFVQLHWIRLLQGEVVEFYLPAPDILKIARFTLELVTDTPYEATEKVVFRMRVHSWFLRLFIRSTFFVYDLETRNLESIHGVTILRTKHNGEWQKTTNVDIYYEY